MPIYEYKCTECEKEWVTEHNCSEIKTRCPECKQYTLVRVYSDFKINYNSNKPGKITKEAIEEARRDLQEQKREAKKEL